MEGTPEADWQNLGSVVDDVRLVQSPLELLDRHGLGHYTRHHCGYTVGIGYPPSWSGPGVPVGLRRDSDMELKADMVFHLMSWLLQSGEGDAFLSDTIVVTGTGCEFLTTVSRDVLVRS